MRFSCALLLVFCAIAPSYGQKHAFEIKPVLAELNESFNLTSSQKIKVTEILLKKQNDLKILESDRTGSMVVKEKKWEAIDKGSWGSILMILDINQRKLATQESVKARIKTRTDNLKKK